MPKLVIEQPHTLPAGDVRRRLDQNAELAKYGIKLVWNSQSRATFESTAASGSVDIASSKVTVTAQLAFALWPLKSTIESQIRDALSRALS